MQAQAIGRVNFILIWIWIVFNYNQRLSSTFKITYSIQYPAIATCAIAIVQLRDRKVISIRQNAIIDHSFWNIVAVANISLKVTKINVSRKKRTETAWNINLSNSKSWISLLYKKSGNLPHSYTFSLIWQKYLIFKNFSNSPYLTFFLIII